MKKYIFGLLFSIIVLPAFSITPPAQSQNLKNNTAQVDKQSQPVVDSLANEDNSLWVLWRDGKAWINFRLRHERVYLENSALKDATASTIRSRVGFQTGQYHQFDGLFELENVSILGDQDFNSGGGTSPSKTNYALISDPKDTKINQAYLRYSGPHKSEFKLGRQIINLGDQRFIGRYAFRQNDQTFDAISGKGQVIDHLNLYYAYVWQVNRIFGTNAVGASKAYDANSHLFNIAYNPFKYLHATGFVYLIDNQNASTTSNNTYGIDFTGVVPARITNVHYHVAYAYQTDGSNNVADYSENYFNLSMGAKFYDLLGTAGIEILGGDGTNAFQTPYATGHRFNGWADLFLTTPATGLQDYYLSIETTKTLIENIFAKAAYHSFHSDSSSADFGSEIDFLVGAKFFKYFSAKIEYANFQSDSASYNSTQKLWLTLSAGIST